MLGSNMTRTQPMAPCANRRVAARLKRRPTARVLLLALRRHQILCAALERALAPWRRRARGGLADLRAKRGVQTG